MGFIDAAIAKAANASKKSLNPPSSGLLKKSTFCDSAYGVGREGGVGTGPRACPWPCIGENTTDGRPRGAAPTVSIRGGAQDFFNRPSSVGFDLLRGAFPAGEARSWIGE